MELSPELEQYDPAKAQEIRAKIGQLSSTVAELETA